MDLQPKTEPGSPPIFESSGHRNLKEMCFSEIVSVLRADVDRVEEVLLARDAKHEAEIGPLQEKVEVERLMRLQAEEELKKKEEQCQKGKRAQESYEALLKKVKESGLRDKNTIEKLRNKNRELEREKLRLVDLKRKRVDDDSNVVAELRIRVAELENEKLELEDANKKNLATIEKLSAKNRKLARDEKKKKKKKKGDEELLGNVCASVAGNTEGEPQAPLQGNIDFGRTLGASGMTKRCNNHPRLNSQPPDSSTRPSNTSTPFSTTHPQLDHMPSTLLPPHSLHQQIHMIPALGCVPPRRSQLVQTEPQSMPVVANTPTLHHPAIESGAVASSGQQHASTTKQRVHLRSDGKSCWLPPGPGLHWITEVIQKMYDRPYESFAKIPKATKLLWYREWRSGFIIDPGEEDYFFKAWKKRAGKRMREMYHDISEKGAPHRWISESNMRALREYWASDEFMNKSGKAKASRASAMGGSLHCGGSTTIEGTKAKMAKLLNRPPTQAEVFKETHTRKNNKAKWVDTCSEQTYAEFMQRLEEAKSKQGGTVDCPPIDEDMVWLETVGGPYKGRIYGMGTSYVDSFSSHASMIGTSLSHDDEVRDHVHALNMELKAQAQQIQEQNQLHEHERDAWQEKLKILEKKMQKKAKNDKKEIEKKMMGEMQAYFQKMHASCSSEAPPLSPLSPLTEDSDKDDDDNDIIVIHED